MKESLGTEELPRALESSPSGRLVARSVAKPEATRGTRARRTNGKADIQECEGPEDESGDCGLLQGGWFLSFAE